MKAMNIVMGCDEAAFELKEAVRAMLISDGHTVIDKGVYDKNPVAYPDIAAAACEEIISGRAERGILMCGTGIGMSISANKAPGIRAAVCHDPFSAERSRKSNDAQVMCLGARVIGTELAKYLVRLWLTCDFEGGGSTEKVEKIKQYERLYTRAGRNMMEGKDAKDCQ